MYFLISVYVCIDGHKVLIRYNYITISVIVVMIYLLRIGGGRDAKGAASEAYEAEEDLHYERGESIKLSGLPAPARRPSGRGYGMDDLSSIESASTNNVSMNTISIVLFSLPSVMI